MSDSVAILDEEYVRLGRAAALVAQERQQFGEIVTAPSAGVGHKKRPRSSLFVNRHAP